MRHVYVTLQAGFVVYELLEDDFDAVRNPFRVLLHDECFSYLIQQGAAVSNSFEAHWRKEPPGKLPFVPHLGALRLNPKAQVEHRALRHLRGFTTWSPAFAPASPTGIRLVPRTEELVSDH